MNHVRLPNPFRTQTSQNDKPLEVVHSVWEQQARADPLWAVLSDPNKRERHWELSAFLATGEEYVRTTLGRFEELGGTFVDREMAIDFGSGVGRISQPLANRFSHVTGIDISETMIEVARRLNQHGERVEYVRNEKVDLSFLSDDSISFVHTFITLQHVPTAAAKSYLHEFFRIAKPGGGVVFQLPSHYSETYLPADRDDRPLEEGVAVADIEPVGLELAEVEAGSVFRVRIAVTNRGSAAWKQSEVLPLNVGDRWFDADSGNLRVPDDGRSRLPGTLRPNETATVDLLVRAPENAGKYRLQFDVVQEGAMWFADAGNPPFESRLDVVTAKEGVAKSATAPMQGGTSAFEDLIDATYSKPTAFEMHAVPRPEVEALIQSCGGVLLGADEYVNEWHSFTYYVQIPD